MRLIDADKLYDDMLYAMCGTGYQTLALQVIKRAPTIEIDTPNEPLTLEQLREMDGEPVWVVQINGELRPTWMLVDAEDESAADRLCAAMFEDYGTEWLAYHRKLEEGTT